MLALGETLPTLAVVCVQGHVVMVDRVRYIGRWFEWLECYGQRSTLFDLVDLCDQFAIYEYAEGPQPKTRLVFDRTPCWSS